MKKDENNDIFVKLLNDHFRGMPDLEIKKLENGTWKLSDVTGDLYARIVDGVAEFSNVSDFSTISRRIVDLEV